MSDITATNYTTFEPAFRPLSTDPEGSGKLRIHPAQSTLK
jgi:hypothetical protein